MGVAGLGGGGATGRGGGATHSPGDWQGACEFRVSWQPLNSMVGCCRTNTCMNQSSLQQCIKGCVWSVYVICDGRGS